MDFTFSSEQRELREQARSFLEAHYAPARVAQLAESDSGWDPAAWSELAQLGWLGVSVPEELGGAGLSFIEEAILLEEFGRCLFPGPFLSTVGFARPALPADQLAQVAAGQRRWSACLSGQPALVPDLQAVDAVVLVSGDRLLAVPAQGVPATSIDSTRRVGRLTSVEGEVLAAGERAQELIGAMRIRLATALALEAVGVAQRVLEWGLEHVRTREQFGRPIGSYQAVSHPLVDTFVEVELARSLGYWAAWCISVEHPQRGLAAAAAKSAAAEAAVHSCERVIQVHGGMGFTWDSPLQRYYKRALWIEHFGGSPAEHRSWLARELLAGGADDGSDAAGQPSHRGE
ncbi:MAG: acyl-CoA dehydrogenase family protein [Candidatus Dormibacteria bacterium]